MSKTFIRKKKIKPNPEKSLTWFSQKLQILPLGLVPDKYFQIEEIQSGKIK